MLSGLGERWETALVGLKPYAACASAHTTIDGVLELRSRGLSVDNLERLTVRMSKKGHINIGWPYRPGEVITAQMNGSYAAAVALIDGDAFIDQFDESRLADPAILALMPRIGFLHDPELDRGGATKRHAVRIEALRKDGSVLVDRDRATTRLRRSSSGRGRGRAEVPPSCGCRALSARHRRGDRPRRHDRARRPPRKGLSALIGGRAV